MLLLGDARDMLSQLPNIVEVQLDRPDVDLRICGGVFALLKPLG